MPPNLIRIIYAPILDEHRLSGPGKRNGRRVARETLRQGRAFLEPRVSRLSELRAFRQVNESNCQGCYKFNGLFKA